jgi:hypothetical protein
MKLSKYQGRRKGAIIVYAAICMTAIVGLSALTIDIGYKHDRLRHQQGAADASALAAAGNAYKNWLNYNGGNLLNHAKTAATAIATKNGYTDGANGASVTINSPPQSGLFTNTNDGYTYFEVIITQQESQFFSRIFGTMTLQTTARAVSRAAYAEVGDGIIVLDKSAKDALNAHGGGNISVIGSSDVLVNSSNSEAAITNGSGTAQVRAPAFLITGGYQQTGSSTFAQPDGSTPANITTGVAPTPDPLAWLPYPSIPAAGTETVTNMTGGGKLHTFTPGLFISNGNNPAIKVSGQDAIYMNPGIYYLQGGFSYTGSGGVTATGVMIFNDPSASNSQGITVTGGGTVSMSPFNDPNGATPWYDGILFFQNRAATPTLSVTGNGNYTIGGTFYAADALMTISGNGDAYVGSQYISRTLNLGGNGALTINYNAAPHPHKRILQLVE